MTDPARKSPLAQAVDEVLDLTVYGPLGLAITAREELPRMVEKGRQRLNGRVMLARMIGEHAARHGQRMASQAVKQSAQTLISLGLLPGGPETAGPVAAGPVAGGPGTAGPESGAAEPADGAESRNTSGNGRVEQPDGTPVAGSVPARAAAPASAELAIPGYDSLSASQVVQRLAGLAPDELEAVRNYEAAGRGRRTVLNRIAQLQSGRP